MMQIKKNIAKYALEQGEIRYAFGGHKSPFVRFSSACPSCLSQSASAMIRRSHGKLKPVKNRDNHPLQPSTEVTNS